MTTKKTDKIEEKISFEKALERLEAIVNEMESGSLSLDKMIARFEEGQSLLKFCTQKLNEVEKKIEVLVKKGDKISAEPFDEKSVEEESEDKKSDNLF
ncbi:MAG: exodeoxyribonuclease VII small subunit [Kiritimatiellae bacterium]|nr:exodeoxyribonuclease VII small subunit [Kiritimatiellia bacterium]MDD5519977.1 exodeoxyribonuclease VII small subunit [Kiritimatiellia bacterium]